MWVETGKKIKAMCRYEESMSFFDTLHLTMTSLCMYVCHEDNKNIYVCVMMSLYL